jgi:hypothetical protein
MREKWKILKSDSREYEGSCPWDVTLGLVGVKEQFEG